MDYKELVKDLEDAVIDLIKTVEVGDKIKIKNHIFPRLSTDYLLVERVDNLDYQLVVLENFRLLPFSFKNKKELTQFILQTIMKGDKLNYTISLSKFITDNDLLEDEEC